VTVPGRRFSRTALSIGGTLLALCAISLASLVLHAAGATGPAGIAAAALGRFLFDAFSWAGFFVPVYFLAGALLLAAPRFRRRSALRLMLSIVPFLTLSLLLHVLQRSQAPLAARLADSFGLLPAALLLFLLFALELIFLITLPGGSAHRAPRSARPARRAVMALPPLGQAGGEPSFADPFEVDLPGMGARAEPADGGEPAADLDAAADAVPVLEADAVLDTETADDIVPVVGENTAAVAANLDAAEEPSAAPGLPSARKKAAGVMIETRLPQAELPFEPSGKKGPYGIPVNDVLKPRRGDDYWVIDDETRREAQILTDALKEFNIEAEVTGIRKGPVITLFEVLPAQGVRVSKIANLSDNIALRLAAPSVRIVAPIPGRHAVGIEVPNRKRAIVSFKEMVSLDVMQKSAYEIPLALGKDILGEAQVIDLVQTPHLLIGGATNSGKSVLVNSIIASILFRRSPDEVRLFLIDPKIVELKLYNGCPHLLTPVITEPKKAFQALQYCISEMERRYTLLDALGVRDIRAFNKKAKKERVQRLPYIVIVIDEFADLMATTGKELESTLARLAAMARAIGIHMVLATQRPSIDVITGLIKANIPSRIAFMVANKFDSRIIIDAVGAEKLLGKGDMLFSAAWNPFPVRIQGAYIDDDEIDSVTEYVKKLGPPQYIEDEVFFEDEESGDFEGEPGNDPLFERALEVVVGQGKASASYIQRRLKVGYNRAARLVEEMEMRGIVGPAQGSKPREILHLPGKGS
jgi:DNA segregation ATPase FtsK/SpoIIIE, S-DNA-T family